MKSSKKIIITLQVSEVSKININKIYRNFLILLTNNKTSNIYMRCMPRGYMTKRLKIMTNLMKSRKKKFNKNFKIS